MRRDFLEVSLWVRVESCRRGCYYRCGAKWLGLPGEQRTMGRRQRCATCGFFSARRRPRRRRRRHGDGGGTTKFASEATSSTAGTAWRPNMVDRARNNNPKATFCPRLTVEDILGSPRSRPRVRNVKTGETWDIEVDAFSAAIGHAPSTKPEGRLRCDGGRVRPAEGATP